MSKSDFSKLMTAVTAAEPKVVPFGKYRGQPVEVLRQDQNYMDWLGGQEGIRQQYPWIFSVTVNTGAEPAETPEHNRYQALFLDDQFAADVLREAFPHLKDKMTDGTLKRRFEHSAWLHPDMGVHDYQSRDARAVGPADVDLYGEGTQDNYWYGHIRIEIKPVMGDDYPAVLRQMRGNACNVLYLVNYTGSGATLDQVRKMFEASGIRIMLHSDFWE